MIGDEFASEATLNSDYTVAPLSLSCEKRWLAIKTVRLSSRNMSAVDIQVLGLVIRRILDLTTSVEELQNSRVASG